MAWLKERVLSILRGAIEGDLYILFHILDSAGAEFPTMPPRLECHHLPLQELEHLSYTLTRTRSDEHRHGFHRLHSHAALWSHTAAAPHWHAALRLTTSPHRVCRLSPALRACLLRRLPLPKILPGCLKHLRCLWVPQFQVSHLLPASYALTTGFCWVGCLPCLRLNHRFLCLHLRLHCLS